MKDITRAYHILVKEGGHAEQRRNPSSPPVPEETREQHPWERGEEMWKTHRTEMAAPPRPPPEEEARDRAEQYRDPNNIFVFRAAKRKL